MPPKDKDFEELVSMLKGHFKPKLVIITERFNFHRRQQAKGESVAEYISELQKLIVSLGLTWSKPLGTDLCVGSGARRHKRSFWLKQNSPYRMQSK